jgi:transposase-like protein
MRTRVETNLEETSAFYRFPFAHLRHRKSTSLPERLHQEFKRRIPIARIFSDPPNCQGLIRVLAGEIHE